MHIGTGSDQSSDGLNHFGALRRRRARGEERARAVVRPELVRIGACREENLDGAHVRIVACDQKRGNAFFFFARLTEAPADNSAAQTSAFPFWPAANSAVVPPLI